MSGAQLTVGLCHTEHMQVQPRHTVPNIDSSWPGFVDMPAAFATAMMIGFVEQTCIQAIRPFLDDGQCTVGTHVDVSHVAATPAGMTVTATVELIEIDGRTLRFTVSCHDEAGLVGKGGHHRTIVDTKKFTARLHKKANPSSGNTSPGPA